jgi:aldehyde:ferredoxin oxidoreductase
LLTALLEMLNARYGTALTADDLTSLGKQVLKTEHAFNLAAGMTNKDDRLPEFFEETVAPHNAVWDFTDDKIDFIWNF